MSSEINQSHELNADYLLSSVEAKVLRTQNQKQTSEWLRKGKRKERGGDKEDEERGGF